MNKHIKKIICKIFGHKWVYNFNTLPNKCICTRCHQKQELGLEKLEWVDVDEFSSNIGTDDEIIKRWSKNK